MSRYWRFKYMIVSGLGVISSLDVFLVYIITPRPSRSSRHHIYIHLFQQLTPVPPQNFHSDSHTLSLTPVPLSFFEPEVLLPHLCFKLNYPTRFSTPRKKFSHFQRATEAE